MYIQKHSSGVNEVGLLLAWRQRRRVVLDDEVLRQIAHLLRGHLAGSAVLIAGVLKSEVL
jgi:hypothetical protein